MWKERMKKAASALACVIFILIEICGYVLVYVQSRFFRMSFLVIGNWIIPEKAVLGIYIAAAVVGNVVLFFGRDERKVLRTLMAMLGPGMLLVTITRLACGGWLIFTVFFLFLLYLLFWGGQAVWLLLSGKPGKRKLHILIRRIETGTMIFLAAGVLSGLESRARNVYEVSVGLQAYEEISPDFTDEQNLSAWEKHDALSAGQRREIYQILIDSECEYLGIEPVLVQISEEYGWKTHAEYEEENRIITMMEYGMEKDTPEVIQTLCHEVYHAYTRDLVDAFSHISHEEEKLLIFRQVRELERGYERYKKDGSYEEYYNNPVEEYARSYAQARAEAYCRYLPGGEMNGGEETG